MSHIDLAKPQRGVASQPRVQPWDGAGGFLAMRSEGTPHRPVTDGLCGDMRRSFRTRKWQGCFSQGVALRWYAVPRWGKNAMPQRGTNSMKN